MINLPKEIESLFQVINIYKDLYAINYLKFNNEHLFGFVMIEEDKNQKENQRKIEIVISVKPEFYEIKSFNIKNGKKESIEDKPLCGVKMEGCLDSDEFLRDLEDVILNEEKFRFYPNFP